MEHSNDKMASKMNSTMTSSMKVLKRCVSCGRYIFGELAFKKHIMFCAGQISSELSSKITVKKTPRVFPSNTNCEKEIECIADDRPCSVEIIEGQQRERPKSVEIIDLEEDDSQVQPPVLVSRKDKISWLNQQSVENEGAVRTAEKRKPITVVSSLPWKPQPGHQKKRTRRSREERNSPPIQIQSIGHCRTMYKIAGPGPDESPHDHEFATNYKAPRQTLCNQSLRICSLNFPRYLAKPQIIDQTLTGKIPAPSVSELPSTETERSTIGNTIESTGVDVPSTFNDHTYRDDAEEMSEADWLESEKGSVGDADESRVVDTTEGIPEPDTDGNNMVTLSSLCFPIKKAADSDGSAGNGSAKDSPSPPVPDIAESVEASGSPVKHWADEGDNGNTIDDSTLDFLVDKIIYGYNWRPNEEERVAAEMCCRSCSKAMYVLNPQTDKPRNVIIAGKAAKDLGMTKEVVAYLKLMSLLWYVCPVCEIYFKHFLTWRKHLKNSHTKYSNTKQLCCRLCSDVKSRSVFIVYDDAMLKTHAQEIHAMLSSQEFTVANNSIFLCDICGCAAKTEFGLKHHRNKYHGKIPLLSMCPFPNCDIKLPVHLLDEHWSLKHRGCPYCLGSFNATGFKAHLHRCQMNHLHQSKKNTYQSLDKIGKKVGTEQSSPAEVKDEDMEEWLPCEPLPSLPPPHMETAQVSAKSQNISVPLEDEIKTEEASAESQNVSVPLEDDIKTDVLYFPSDISN